MKRDSMIKYVTLLHYKPYLDLLKDVLERLEEDE